MAWSNSKIMRQALADILGNTTAMDFNSDSSKFALFDNSITPDNDVSAANSAFGAGVWASGQVFDGTEWATGGVAVGSPTIGVGTADTVILDGNDVASGSSATLSAYGGLLYDDTIATPVADQGWSYHYFGGQVSVVDGTLTVVWNASGIMSFAL